MAVPIGTNEIVEIEEDDDSIDDSQLVEYQEMVEELGSFPDKLKINTLTMIAEDYTESLASASAIYSIIRQRMLNTTNRDNILPIVYLIDSILKNVKGCFVALLEKDAIEWMPTVYQKLNEMQRVKLEKVWKTWNEFKIFSLDSWRAMGKCFAERVSGSSAAVSSFTAVTEITGITRTNNGTLILPANLRKEMQSILDELQSGMQNELEKVSLEKLADLNPGLLGTIKATAEESILSARSQSIPTKQDTASSTDGQRLPSFFPETQSPEIVIISKEWKDLKNWKPSEQALELVSKMQSTVREGSSSERATLYTKDQATQMTKYYATVSAATSLLATSVERIQKQKERQASMATKEAQRKTTLSSGSFAVDKNDFSNEGIKKRNEAVVGLLYQIGLPFVSSVDGRRFRTQVELSNHLDALFKRNQLEKSIARTEERGWYVPESVWLREVSEYGESSTGAGVGNEAMHLNDADGINADSYNEMNTVPADESRDKCVICGLNFKMFFDNDDGIYKYSNCKEIEVLNDDAAETESDLNLVHVSCWKGLGSPEVLTTEQIIHENM